MHGRFCQLMRRWLRSDRATAALEFGLTVPTLLLFIGGIVEFGRAFQVYAVVNRLAAQYAIVWADCSDPSNTGVCSTEMTNYTAANAIANIAPQLVASRLTLQMFQVLMSGTTPTIVYAYPTGATLSTAQATLSSGQSAVIVTASYSHTLVYFSALMTPFLGSHLTPAYTIVQLKS
jgi:Flp pilus assembly protein TadG